jgi:hypothetical protein
VQQASTLLAILCYPLIRAAGSLVASKGGYFKIIRRNCWTDSFISVSNVSSARCTRSTSISSRTSGRGYVRTLMKTTAVDSMTGIEFDQEQVFHDTERGDLLLIRGDDRLLIDVTIVRPTAPSPLRNQRLLVTHVVSRAPPLPSVRSMQSTMPSAKSAGGR